MILMFRRMGLRTQGLSDTSISPGRALPQLALKKDQVVAGIEYDEDELLQFVVTPYYLQGKRVGVLEIGGSLGRQVNALKKFHNVDGGLLLHDRQLVDPTTPDLVERAFRLGKPGRFLQNGEWYSTFRIPVKGPDFSDGEIAQRVASYLVVANVTGARRLLSSSLTKLAFQVVGILALVIPLAFVGINVMWKPLQGVIGSVQAVAQQDLSVAVEAKGSGEVAILTGAVNTMITDLRALVGAILEMSQKVNQMAGDLSKILQEQVTSSAMQSRAVAEVATSMEELTRISQKNTESAEGVAGAAESTTLRIEEGHLTNQNAKQAFERIVGEIQKTTEAARHISQASLQQQEACEQSLSTFRQIALGVKSLADASQEARVSVTRLVEFAGSVEKLVTNFKLQ